MIYPQKKELKKYWWPLVRFHWEKQVECPSCTADVLQVEQKTPPQTRQWCLRRIVPKDLEQRGQALASLSGTKWSTQPYHFLPPGEPVLPTLAGEPMLSTLVVLTMLPTEASLMAGLPTSSSMGDGGSRMGFSCTHPARL